MVGWALSIDRGSKGSVAERLAGTPGAVISVSAFEGVCSAGGEGVVEIEGAGEAGVAGTSCVLIGGVSAGFACLEDFGLINQAIKIRIGIPIRNRIRTVHFFPDDRSFGCSDSPTFGGTKAGSSTAVCDLS